ncbi:MAG: super-infection exclusion protein B [Bacteroidetes bacterium]|nr:super-infection exclusion protein B [Bacteroidota bacterium]
MSVVKDIREFAESNVRFRVLIIAWIGIVLLVVLAELNILQLRSSFQSYVVYFALAFCLLTAWLLVEAILWFFGAGSARARATNARRANQRKLMNLPPRAKQILRYWTIPQNRYKAQELDFTDDDVSALERADIIAGAEPVLYYSGMSTITSYHVQEWAADILESEPKIVS